MPSRSSIAEMRVVWRSIPPELRRLHPNLVSRVQVTENGVIAGIFRHRGQFRIEGVGDTRILGNLIHAEDFAVEALIRQEVAG